MFQTILCSSEEETLSPIDLFSMHVMYVHIGIHTSSACASSIKL